jgi:hypothetical protein
MLLLRKSDLRPHLLVSARAHPGVPGLAGIHAWASVLRRWVACGGESKQDQGSQLKPDPRAIMMQHPQQPQPELALKGCAALPLVVPQLRIRALRS